MKESANLAMNWVKSHASQVGQRVEQGDSWVLFRFKNLQVVSIQRHIDNCIG